MNTRIIILCVVLLVPIFAFAQGLGLVPCDGPLCQACDLLKLVKNVLDYAIELVTFVAVLVIMYVGWEYMTSGDNAGKRTAAKGRLTNIAIGFAILLSAWLIVDTGLKLLFHKQQYGAWNEIKCVPLPTYTQRQTATPTSPAVVSSASKYDSFEARRTLERANISVNKPEPPSPEQSKEFTSLQGINKNVIDEVWRLKNLCMCDVVVTGGTEDGHAEGEKSHANGYKIDLRPNDKLDAYIMSNATPDGTRSGDTVYRHQNVEYVREGDHWDITVN